MISSSLHSKTPAFCQKINSTFFLVKPPKSATNFSTSLLLPMVLLPIMILFHNPFITFYYLTKLALTVLASHQQNENFRGS